MTKLEFDGRLRFMNSSNYIQISVSSIEIDVEFSKLMPPDEEDLDPIVQSMIDEGYDEAEPVVLWKEPGTAKILLVEGHRRVEAATRARRLLIWAVFKEFKDREAVKRYIKKRQRDRRHTKNATIVHALLTHPLYSHGGKRLEESKVPDGMLNKVGEKGEVTLQTIADDLGVTRVRVARLKKRYFDELKRPQIIAFKEGKRTALDLIREIDDNRPSPFGSRLERILMDEFNIYPSETQEIVQRALALELSPRKCVAHLIREGLKALNASLAAGSLSKK